MQTEYCGAAELWWIWEKPHFSWTMGRPMWWALGWWSLLHYKATSNQPWSCNQFHPDWVWHQGLLSVVGEAWWEWRYQNRQGQPYHSPKTECFVIIYINNLWSNLNYILRESISVKPNDESNYHRAYTIY